MTISTTATPAPPRRLGRSVAALFSGFVAVVVLSLGTDEVLHLVKVYPPWNQPMYDSGLYLLALSYRIVYTVRAACADGPRFNLRCGGNGCGNGGRDRYHPDALGAGVVSDRDCGYCLAVCLAGRSSTQQRACLTSKDFACAKDGVPRGRE